MFTIGKPSDPFDERIPPFNLLPFSGATTLTEYRQFMEKDKALERRFQQVMVDQPTVEVRHSFCLILMPALDLSHSALQTTRPLLSYTHSCAYDSRTRSRFCAG